MSCRKTSVINIYSGFFFFNEGKIVDAILKDFNVVIRFFAEKPHQTHIIVPSIIFICLLLSKLHEYFFSPLNTLDSC